MTLLFDSLKELKSNNYNISSDQFLHVILDIMKAEGLNLMSNINFLEKDIKNVINLFNNCNDRLYIRELDEYRFNDRDRMSEETKELLEQLNNSLDFER